MDLKINSPETLGSALRSERKRKGLTQEKVGQSVAMEQYTVSRLEKGNPQMEIGTLFRVLAALDLELVIRPRQKHDVSGTGDAW